jgi:peptidoglycan/LPS O-acetylase OafA/YrhL
MRLTSIFLVGAWFFVKREDVAFSPIAALVSALCLLAGLRTNPLLAQIAVAIFGGYLIIFAAHRAKGFFTSINNRNDVSYGLYLYAWPVGALTLWYAPQASLVLVGMITLFLSYALGWTSWRIIERPALRRFGQSAEIRDQS